MSRSVFFLVAGWVLVSTGGCFLPKTPFSAKSMATVCMPISHKIICDPTNFSRRPLTAIARTSLLLLPWIGPRKTWQWPQDAEIDFPARAPSWKAATDPVRSFDVARSLERVPPGRRTQHLGTIPFGSPYGGLAEGRTGAARQRYQEGLKEQRAALQKYVRGRPPATVET